MTTLLVTSFLAQAFVVIVPLAILLMAWLAYQDRLGVRLDLHSLWLLMAGAGVLGWLFVPGALGRERSIFDLIAAVVLLAILIRLAHPLLRYMAGRPPADDSVPAASRADSEFTVISPRACGLRQAARHGDGGQTRGGKPHPV